MPASRTVRVLAAGAAVASVVLGGCGTSARDGSGQVTVPATTDTFSVRVGDCLDKLPTDSTSSLSLLPCAQAHYWEAFATATLTGDDFPGNAAVREAAEKACDDPFEAFVGIAASTSKLELTMLTPTKDTWTQASDREVVCLVGSSAGKLTGSLRGVAK